MIILGVDPGSQNLGFGVVKMSGDDVAYVAHGVLVAKASLPYYDRLHQLGLGFAEIVEKYQPHWVSIENVFLGKNADSAFKLGHIRGVCVFEAIKRGTRISEYATREIKKGVTGQGAAEKSQVAMMLETLLSLPRGQITDHSLDASDALAAAYYHSQRLLIQGRLAAAGLDPMG